MILRFECEGIFIEETDLDVLIVGFHADEEYFVIQQSLDIENAVYHIERDDQSYGGYGGVDRIALTRDRLEVTLNETGRKNLQRDGVEIDFETDDETYRQLVEKLVLIFGERLSVD
ncbi:MAG: hypothetical protein JSS81_01980 [Acidobacteria bacterium]|nr:hypothetical protein [Acidobacteriota bacterium]